MKLFLDEIAPSSFHKNKEVLSMGKVEEQKEHKWNRISIVIDWGNPLTYVYIFPLDVVLVAWEREL
jgi:hypothetical protein